MPDITAEAAAKRPFDEHRLAVLTLQIFSLEEPEPIIGCARAHYRPGDIFRRAQRPIGCVIPTAWPILPAW
jgi:hypothetical protein